MEGTLTSIGYQALGILVPALCAMAIELLRRRLGLEKMNKLQKELGTKKELAGLAVRFAEQAYKDLHGQEKYDQAAIWLSGQAKQRGIKISDEEVKGLIEASLKTAKEEFAQQWGSIAGK